MGQYYKPVLMGKRYGILATFHAHEYGNGLKLTEHSYLGNNFVNAVLSKIDHQPMRVAWIGDYSDDPWDGDEPYQKKIDREKFMRIFKNQNTKRIHPEPLEGFNNPEDYNGWYLINHTRRAYVDLGEFQKANGWKEEWKDRYGVIHKEWWAFNPLPLLTACGNGRGGGDYHESCPDNDKVGLWAFDVIEFAKYKPVGFTKEEYHFKEEE